MSLSDIKIEGRSGLATRGYILCVCVCVCECEGKWDPVLLWGKCTLRAEQRFFLSLSGLRKMAENSCQSSVSVGDVEVLSVKWVLVCACVHLLALLDLVHEVEESKGSSSLYKFHTLCSPMKLLLHNLTAAMGTYFGIKVGGISREWLWHNWYPRSSVSVAWAPSNDLESSNIGQHHTTLYQHWPASYYAVPVLASIILRCTNIGQHHTTLYQYWPASYYAVPILASVILCCTNNSQHHTTLYQYWPASYYAVQILASIILRCTNIGQRHLPSGMSVARA